jgi:hypothetical protein
MSEPRSQMESLKKPLSPKVMYWGLALVCAGIILYVIGYSIEPRRAAFNNLINFLFFTSIAVGALFLIALEYIAGAVWSVPMRRVNEFLAGLIPFAPLLAIPLFFHFHDLFRWTHTNLIVTDELLAAKAPYLNSDFFILRFAATFVLWILFYWFFTRNSLKQDSKNDTEADRYTRNNIRLSAIFLPMFAGTITFFAIDWAMSLEPHWFSTIIGIYYFSGTVVAALAAATYIIIRFHETGRLPGLRRDHFYSLGSLMFAFVNFWAYIAFSQFMLIWYANLPEETFWFMNHWRQGWQAVSILLIIVQFAVPYLVLLPQEAKLDPKRLKFIALWLLVAHWLDLYWLVMPTYDASVTFGWMELSLPVLVIGLIITVVAWKTKKHNLMPLSDPKFKRGIEFHL